LFQDLIEFSPLGINAIGMMLIAYTANIFYARIQHYVFWHQSLWVFVFVAAFGFYSNWFIGIFVDRDGNGLFFVAALTSAIIWSPLAVLMKSIQIHLRLTTAIHNNY
jgi:rod shape-determining protein MreD